MVKERSMSRACRVVGVLLCVAAAGLAADLREVRPRGVGFIGPMPWHNPPETTGCGDFTYNLGVGFPYRNRSVVIDLGTPQAVHRLLLLDDHLDNGGTSPVLMACGLQIYTSDDDRTYRLYQPAFTLTARSGKPEGVFDVVEIDGLAIVARYIKLHADLADERWDFGSNNLQKMVRAYADPDRAAAIGSLKVSRYAETSLSVKAQCQRPKVVDGVLELRFLAAGGAVGSLPVDEAGRVEGTVDISRLPMGPNAWPWRRPRCFAARSWCATRGSPRRARACPGRSLSSTTSACSSRSSPRGGA
jgi:hypothetical protein